MAAGAGRPRALTRLFAIGGATGSASVVAPFLKWKLRLNRETTLAAHPASAAGAVGTDVTQIIEYTVGGPTFGDQTEVAIRPDQNKRAGPNVIGAVRMTFRYQDASSAYVPRMRKRLKLAEFESSPLPDLRFVAISFLRVPPGHPIQSLAPRRPA